MASLTDDARTFPPLLRTALIPAGTDVAVEEFLVFTFTGAEPPGVYVVFPALARPGALDDGQVDPGDLLAVAQETLTPESLIAGTRVRVPRLAVAPSLSGRRRRHPRGAVAWNRNSRSPGPLERRLVAESTGAGAAPVAQVLVTGSRSCPGTCCSSRIRRRRAVASDRRTRRRFRSRGSRRNGRSPRGSCTSLRPLDRRGGAALT